MKFEGRVWKFGDDINTDLITPSQYLDEPLEELKKHVFEPVSKKFADEVEEGDIIIAGKNFGSGSSRETAPSAIKASGISVIVAESFARIFFRNSIAIGLPVVECTKASEYFETGDRVEVDMESGKISDGEELDIQPLPSFVREIIEEGGILNRI